MPRSAAMNVASLRSSANDASPSTSSADSPASASAARTASTASAYSLVSSPPHLAYGVSPTPTRHAARAVVVTALSPRPGRRHTDAPLGPHLVGVLTQQRGTARHDPRRRRREERCSRVRDRAAHLVVPELHEVSSGAQVRVVEDLLGGADHAPGKPRGLPEPVQLLAVVLLRQPL